MLRVAERVQTEKLSVRKVEEIVRNHLARPQAEATKTPSAGSDEAPNEYGEVSRAIQEALGLQARVKSARKGGRIEIRFRTKEELEAILALLVPDGTASEEHPEQA